MAGTATGKSVVAVSQAAAPLAAERPLAHPLSVAAAGQHWAVARLAQGPALAAQLAETPRTLEAAPARECVGE